MSNRIHICGICGGFQTQDWDEFQAHRTREILARIKENGGPEGLDLSDKDLSGIDLGREAIKAELEKARERAPDETPEWCYLRPLDINLAGTDLQEVDLSGTNLQKADLQGANLQRADLQGANLRETKLWLASLQGAFLWGADLRGACLVGLDLEGAGPFGAKSLEGAYFYRAWLDDTRLEREQLGGAIGEDLEEDYGRAKEAYLALKSNFAHIGRYDDAAWAYRKERRMEKLAALQEAREAWQENDWKGAIPHYAKVVGDQVIEWVCDYGEGFWNVVRSLIAVWVIFALIYGLIGGVWGPWQDTGPARVRHITRNPIELLSFSLRAMTTGEPIGVEARPMLAMRILAPLEALLGIFLAGLLGFVAGNRIRRS